MLANDFTLLVMSGPGVSPYSARGLTQTYEPIQASAHLERDVNGNLLDFSAPQMRKYKSKISCTDQNEPALCGVWPGTIVTVECVKEMSFLTSTPEMQERPAVAGSVRTEGDHTFYRPQMTFVFMNHSSSYEEFHHVITWTFEFEEL